MTRDYADYTAAERRAYARGLAAGVTRGMDAHPGRVQRRLVKAGVLAAGMTLATSAVAVAVNGEAAARAVRTAARVYVASPMSVDDFDAFDAALDAAMAGTDARALVHRLAVDLALAEISASTTSSATTDSALRRRDSSTLNSPIGTRSG